MRASTGGTGRERTVSISEEIGQSKVNEVDLVCIRTNSHDEVTRFDIAMDYTRRVKLFEAFDLRAT